MRWTNLVKAAICPPSLPDGRKITVKSSLQYMAQRTEPGLSYCEAQLGLEVLSHTDQITSPATGPLILLLSPAAAPHGLPSVGGSSRPPTVLTSQGQPIS